MDIEQDLKIADEVVFLHSGRRLSAVEMLVLRGCWQDDTYDQIAEATGYSLGYLNRTVAPKLWQTLSDAFGEKTGKKNLRFVIERYQRKQSNPLVSSAPPASVNVPSQLEELEVKPPSDHPRSISPPLPNQPPTPTQTSSQVDWGEAIDVSNFHGWQTDLALLTQWICAERCRLVVLLGMGGLGKTTLAVKLARELATSQKPGEVGETESVLSKPESAPFEFVIWRSLHHTPPLEILLADLIAFLSQKASVQADLGNFLQCLRQSRCLILLDGLESLLQAGEIGRFRSGYENYGELLRLVGETSHQSCVVVTSREKLAEVSVMEGIDSSVRSLKLEGSPAVVQRILQDKGLVGTAAQMQQLGNLYGNNPLALKIVATSIQELFEGNIEAFLQEETLLLNGIRRLLDQHFQRLSSLEQSILYWLVVNRQGVTSNVLLADIVPPISKSRLLEALEALSLRSLIERQTNRYTLQPVIMEYVMEQFTERLVQELKTTELSLFLHHAILKATANDDLPANQRTLILQSIASQLSRQFGSLAALEQQTLQILTQLRRSGDRVAGYGAGNLLNLMHQLGLDLTHYDFSNLTVWQADLRSAVLHQVNFTEADLTNTCFATTSDGDRSNSDQYAGMNITGATGLTEAQKMTLKQLGAIV